MKRLLFILIFVIGSLAAFSQVSPVTDYRIANATTAFGKNLPKGTKILDINTHKVWAAIGSLSTVQTLTTAADSLQEILTGYTENDPFYLAWDKDYNDLINKPTIPTVNNPVITLQGTAVVGSPQSFTLNQSGTQTITINDGWGVDTVVHDNTLLGTGVPGDSLKVNTVIIETKAHAEATYLQTEVQVLSISNDTIFLTGGSFAKLPTASGDNWGTQVVVTDSTLFGTGATGDVLSVNGANVEVPVDNIYSGSFSVNYGYLYNFYAVVDANNIAPSGWHVPVDADFATLTTYLGGWNATTAAKLKEAGTTHWTTDNGTNLSGFNARGSGVRSETGTFSTITTENRIWGADWDWSGGFGLGVVDAIPWVAKFGFPDSDEKYKASGYSVRLVKDATSLSDGEESTMTGNDGKVYRTICIGTQEWLADALCETKYRDGSLIPEVTDAATWEALTTGARCSYDNTESNALTETLTYGITETDPVFTAWDKTTGISITESQISDFGIYLTTEVDGSISNELQVISIGNDTIYLSNGGFVVLPAETDPVFGAHIVSNIVDNTGFLKKTLGGAWAWDNTSYLATETDPIYSASSWSGTANNSTNWNTAYTHSQLITGNPHSVLATQITDFDTEVANNSAVAANTAKVTNATHTNEVVGNEALTVSSNVIDYDNLDETLKQAVTDNDGAFDMNGSGIINCSVSTNTTFSFSNILTTRSIAIKLTISSSATVSWNSTPLDIRGDAISGDGTYLIHIFSWGTTEGDLEVTVKAL